jgi:hypothetical protein
VDTLTHARVRAAQGDVAGARRILVAMLARDPEDPGARRLLADLAGSIDRDRVADADEPVAPAQPRGAADLAPQFRALLGGGRASARARIRRLERWLERVGRNV